MARIRKSFGLRQVNITSVAFDAQNRPVAGAYVEATVSENRAFRMFGATRPSMEEGKPAVLTDWVQVDFQAPRGSQAFDEGQLEFVVQTILREGLVVDGELFVRCLRSASMVRSGVALFVKASLDRDHVRNVLSFGAKFGKRNLNKGALLNPDLPADAIVENLAKMEARYGLALSTSLDTGLRLGVDLSYEIRPDFKRTIQVEVFGRGVQDVEIAPLDGMGTIRPITALRVAERLELLTWEESRLLAGHILAYGFCHSMRQHPDFRALWLKKVPSAFQIRCAGVKGLQVVYPHDELHGVDRDLVITESQWKYDYTQGEPTLEICGWQKAPKSKFVRLNYQFVQALRLSGEQVVQLAKNALSRIESGVLSDPNAAMAFLGMIAAGEEDASYSESLVSMLTRTLDANPLMLSDLHIQKALRRLLERTINDMALAKIPVEGEYRYIVGDPTLLFAKEIGSEQGVLGAGQNYLGGQVGEWAAFRSPLIHRSEVCKLNTVDVAEWSALRLFQGLVVLSSYEDTLPRASGADADGDKVLLTHDPLILSGITGGALLSTEAREGTLQEITWDNMIRYDLLTAGGSGIGAITNLATTKMDLALCRVEKALVGEQESVEPALSIVQFESDRTAFEALVAADDCPF